VAAAGERRKEADLIARVQAPSGAELHAALGRCSSAWPQILSGLEERFGSLTLEWRPSEVNFGRLCVVHLGEEPLLYLMPMAGQLLVGIVLSERAYDLAMASELRESFKTMLRDARPGSDGRGIRLMVKSAADVAQVLLLAECKMAPDGEVR